MRRLIALLALATASVLGSQAFAQAPMSPVMQGLFLLTDYPAQTVRAGEIATIRVKMQNSGLAPEPMALTLSGVPAGWKIDILGGGQPVASAMPGQNESVALQLRVEVPKDAKPGSQQVMLSAKGSRLQSAELPLTLTVGTETPAKLSLKSRLPSLRGTPRSSFEYSVTVGNDSGKDLTVALSAQGPANFQTTFTEGFGSNEISSIPIEAGQTKDIKVKVTPPRDVKAGDYPVLVKVAAEGATAELRVTLQISGQGKLALSTTGGRLSGEAEIGKTSTYTLVLTNDGTAAVDEIEMMMAKIQANLKMASQVTQIAQTKSAALVAQKVEEKADLKEAVVAAESKVEKMADKVEMLQVKMIGSGVDTALQEISLKGPAYDAYLNYVEEGGKEEFEYFRLYIWQQK